MATRMQASSSECSPRGLSIGKNSNFYINSQLTDCTNRRSQLTSSISCHVLLQSLGNISHLISQTLLQWEMVSWHDSNTTGKAPSRASGKHIVFITKKYTRSWPWILYAHLGQALVPLSPMELLWGYFCPHYFVLRVSCIVGRFFYHWATWEALISEWSEVKWSEVKPLSRVQLFETPPTLSLPGSSILGIFQDLVGYPFKI